MRPPGYREMPVLDLMPKSNASGLPSLELDAPLLHA